MEFWLPFVNLTHSGIQTYGSWMQVLSGLLIGEFYLALRNFQSISNQLFIDDRRHGVIIDFNVYLSQTVDVFRNVE